MFSRTCEYAIRGLIFIAHETEGGGRIGVKDIAKGIDSSEYFIAKILQDLTKKGFLHSAKGPKGGFYFNEEDLGRTLASIVREMDGDRVFEGCALGLPECGDHHPCPLHSQFRTIRHALKDLLETTKIGDLTGKLDERLAFLKP